MKDSIQKGGGVDKFPIIRKLINFKSYAKYQEYLTAKRGEQERVNALKVQKEAALSAAEARKQELETLQNQIEKCELQVKAADEIIADGNRDLGVALDSSKKTEEKTHQSCSIKDLNWSRTEKTAGRTFGKIEM